MTMDAYQDAKLDLFKTLLELRLDRKIMGSASPIVNFQQAAQIRAQAERIQAIAGQFRQPPGGNTVSGIAGELRDIEGTLTQMEKSLKEASTTLAGLVSREFSASQILSVPPLKAHMEAYFWRSRIIADLFSASGYYKLAAELLSLAVKTLGNVSPSAESGDASWLLNHAATLLVDAAKQMGTAGTELGDHETHWLSLERALDMIGRK
jgi:hypothetical protein